MARTHTQSQIHRFSTHTHKGSEAEWQKHWKKMYISRIFEFKICNGIKYVFFYDKSNNGSLEEFSKLNIFILQYLIIQNNIVIFSK